MTLVNFRLIAAGRLKQPKASPAPPRAASSALASGNRPIWFSPDAPQDTPVYDRAGLCPDDLIVGPAVIEQLDSTTLLFPGDRARIDPYLNLDVELSP
jgi:N-methylhydantoinase A